MPIMSRSTRRSITPYSQGGLSPWLCGAIVAPQHNNTGYKTMKRWTYKTQEDTTANTCGTFGQGGVNCKYKTLVTLFGEPFEGSADGKTDAEWVIEFMDGKVATIYNWKNGKSYAGDKGKNIENITEWNIGGNCFDVARRIADWVHKIEGRI